MSNHRFLFRGKDIDSQFKIGFYSAIVEPMDEPMLLHYITNYDNKSFIVYFDSVGQCTGLSAKKSYRGEKPEDLLIFKGDILHYEFEDSTNVVVEFAMNNQQTMLMRKGTRVADLDYFTIRFCEIIGTIYENPELLK